MRTDARRPDELINTAGAAALLGVTRAAVANYRARPSDPPFPDPWLEIPARGARNHTALYVRAEVETWAADQVARNRRNLERLERQLAAARAHTARLEARR